MAEDWRDALKALGETLPVGDDTPAAEVTSGETADKKNKSARLTVFYERKGRAGKSVTIICGFADDETAATVASELKKTLGCGGSARCGEVLLQGDRREDVKRLLTAKGYKI